MIKRADPALKRLVAAAPAAPAAPAGRRIRACTRPCSAASAADAAAVELVSRRSATTPSTDIGPAAMPRTPGVARIQAIRRTVLPDVVRIAIELDQEIEYRYERIEGPVRVFLDLVGTEVGADRALDDAV